MKLEGEHRRRCGSFVCYKGVADCIMKTNAMCSKVWLGMFFRWETYRIKPYRHRTTRVVVVVVVAVVILRAVFFLFSNRGGRVLHMHVTHAQGQFGRPRPHSMPLPQFAADVADAGEDEAGTQLRFLPQSGDTSHRPLLKPFVGQPARQITTQIFKNIFSQIFNQNFCKNIFRKSLLYSY